MARLFSIAVLVVFAAAVEWLWGWGRILEPWRQVPLATVLLTVGCQFASYVLRGVRLYFAEARVPRGELTRCVRLVLLNNALNLLLPVRSGETSFPLLLRAWFGLELSRGVGTLLWMRSLDLYAILVAGGSAWLAHGALAGTGWRGLALAAVVAALLSPLLVPRVRGPLHGYFARHPHSIGKTLANVLDAFPDETQRLLVAVAWTWLAWGVKLLGLGVLLMQLAGVSLSAGLLGSIGGDLSTVLPLHTPGGFGTYEAGVLAGLAPIAGFRSAWVAAAVNLHLMVLGLALAAGGVAWLAGPPVRLGGKMQA